MKKLTAFFVKMAIAPQEAAALSLIVVVVAGIIVFIILGGIVFSQIGACNMSRWTKKTGNVNANIANGTINAAISETIANVQENKVREGNQNVINKETDANAVRGNLNRVLSTDSSQFSNSAADARRAYCADSPGDSLCRNQK